MGRRWGRPDISRYADRFDVPAADGGLAVTFLGVASLLVSDGTSAVLTYGFFSLPSLPRVLLRRITPDRTRIQETLGRASVTAVDAVVPVHTHYDHALDSATVAAATGAPARRGLGHTDRRRRWTAPGPHHPRHAGPSGRLRPVHSDADRVGPLPTRPVPRCHRAPGRAAGAGVGIPLR